MQSKLASGAVTLTLIYEIIERDDPSMYDHAYTNNNKEDEGNLNLGLVETPYKDRSMEPSISKFQNGITTDKWYKMISHMNLGIIIKLEASQTFKIKFDLINIVKIPK